MKIKILAILKNNWLLFVIYFALLIFDVLFLIKIWMNVFGIIGVVVNIVVFIGVLVLWVDWALFKQNIDLQLQNVSEKDHEIDKQEIINLKHALESIIKDNNNQFKLPIKDLAGAWRDKEEKDIIEDLRQSEEGSIKLDVNSFKMYWKKQEQDNENQYNTQKQFNKIESQQIFISIEDFLKSRFQGGVDLNINIGQVMKFILYLIHILDQKGDCPSVVDLHDNPNDPDSMKRSIEILNTNLYQILTQISLLDHTYRTVYNTIKFLQSNKDINVVSVASCIIAALGHDIGKIPEYYKGKKLSHAVISAEILYSSMLADFVSNGIMQTVHDVVLNHHLVLNKPAFDYNMQNIVIYSLYMSDMEARKFEKEIKLNQTKEMFGVFNSNIMAEPILEAVDVSSKEISDSANEIKSSMQKINNKEKNFQKYVLKNKQ